MRGLGLGAALAMAVAACAPTPRQADEKGAALKAAGFSAWPADTEARRALLMRLPANQFVKHQGDVAWVYADPAICRCVYAGSQDAYERFRLNRSQSAGVHGMESATFVENKTFDWNAYGPWGARYDFPTRIGF